MNDATPPRVSRRTLLLAALLVAAVALLLTARWATEPERVARLVLDRAGAALGLEIHAGGVSEYRLRGAPRLVVRDLVVRQPGAGTPLLTAERASLTLPWSTIRSRGSDLVLERIELDAPQLDLAALQRWQASRPPSKETRIPTVTDGVAIERGKLLGDGWSVDGIALQLPSLAPQDPVGAHVAGRLLAGDMRLPFDLHVALTRPAPGAGLGVAGTVRVLTGDWRLPMTVRASGRVYAEADGIGLDGFRFGAQANLVSGGDALPFAFGLAGPLRYRDGHASLAPLGVALRGEGVVPSFDAQGRFGWGPALALHLRGALPDWPQAWPALPAPLAGSNAPLPFDLEYSGPLDLSGRTSLALSRDAARFDANFRLPQVLDWLDRIATGTPLPPLDGRLSAPRLEIAGATLEGVEVEFEDE